ncbi:MAG: pilus assembly protein PilM [Myxococcota bacterium]
MKNVLGLDVGSHSLKAVELEQGLRTLEVVRTCMEPRDPELALSDQIARMLQTHSMQGDHVVAAIRGDRVSVRRLSFPFAEKRRLAQAVPFELEDQVPYDLDEMIIDWDVASKERNRSEVLSVLAPRVEIAGLIDSLHEAFCDPRTIEAEGLVLANLTSAFELEGTHLLVDIGHEKTTLCALHQGAAVAARSFSIAGHSFTEAIADERSLTIDNAERYKQQHGVAEPGVGTPFPRAAEILDKLADEIVRFASAIEPQVPGGVDSVHLFGGGALLSGIDEWLTDRVGIPVERIGLPKEETGLGLVAGGSPVQLAPALALALRGTARATTQINLRQDDFARRADFTRVRREFSSTGTLAAIVAGIAVLSFSVGAVFESQAAGRVEGEIERLHQEAFPGQAIPDNPISAMREAVRDANERAEFLGVYRGNLSALDLLTEISRRVPKDLDVGFEELSIDKQTIRIRVYATSFEAADRLGAELSKFGPFDQARIGAIESDRRTGGKKFNVTISLASREDAES